MEDVHRFMMAVALPFVEGRQREVFSVVSTAAAAFRIIDVRAVYEHAVRAWCMLFGVRMESTQALTMAWAADIYSYIRWISHQWYRESRRWAATAETAEAALRITQQDSARTIRQLKASASVASAVQEISQSQEMYRLRVMELEHAHYVDLLRAERAAALGSSTARSPPRERFLPWGHAQHDSGSPSAKVFEEVPLTQSPSPLDHFRTMVLRKGTLQDERESSLDSTAGGQRASGRRRFSIIAPPRSPPASDALVLESPSPSARQELVRQHRERVERAAEHL